MKNNEKIIIDERFDELRNKIIRADILPAKELLKKERIDICVKYQYIRSVYFQLTSSSYLESVYRSTIKYFSDGLYIEPGASDKQSFSDYNKVFINLLNNIKSKGFDNSLGVIPLSRDGIPLDGAHRIAVAAVLDIEIPVVYLDVETQKYDCNFFLRKGAKGSEVKSYLKCLYDVDHDLRVAVVWPYSQVSDNELKEIYGDSLVFSEKISLDRNGIRNLCLLSYSEESWSGGVNNSWNGIQNKADPCYKDRETRILYFSTSGLEHDIEKKESVRAKSDGSKNNIHSTDTYKETLIITNITLSKYSDFILNNLNRIKLSEILKEINLNKLNDNYILVGSSILSLFNLRVNHDIDVLNSDNVTFSESFLGSHNNYLGFYNQNFSKYKVDIFSTMKILDLEAISIDELIFFKRSRNEEKDINDLLILSEALKNGTRKKDIKYFFEAIKSNFKVFYYRNRERIVFFSKKLGVYKIIRRVKNTFK